MNNKNETLENVIKHYRRFRRIKQVDFAKKCNLSKGTIGDLEINSINPRFISPTLATIEKLAKGMEMDAIELLKLIEKENGKFQIY